MPIFFTHSDLHSDFAEDEDGAEFDSLESASEHTIRAGRAFVADQLKDGADAVSLTLYIDNESGERLSTLAFTGSITGP